MSDDRNLLAGFALLVILVFGYGWYVENHLQVVHITDQDIVRYCMDRRRSKAPLKEIEYYCRDMGGDYYAASGVKPNYEKYDSRRMFPDSTPTPK